MLRLKIYASKDFDINMWCTRISRCFEENPDYHVIMNRES